MLIAHIREAECIGCSRCIPACPVDAILGTNKFLHSVLTDECIGCRLCIDPCPVDCIEMVETTSTIDKPTLAVKAKQRYIARQQRLQQEAQRQLPIYVDQDQQRVAIRREISAAVARAALKNHHE